mgnify:CR=1 FL=1|tara:strand:- start:1638 stop:2627 length:990 start_codon:yes stop_codon:yes gene_type:complete
MKISVIIPVYNASLTLKECLDSVFESNYKNFEVIVVSDFSSDNSIEIAKNYKCKIIELDENKGPAFARNKGAEESQGDILLFLDSDVIINKNSLDLVSEKFSSKDVNAIQGIYSHEPNYKYLATQFYQSYLCYYVWPEDKKYATTLVTACFGIRKKIFMELKGFDTKMKKATCEDEQFGYVLINKGYKILILRNLQVEHRVNYNTTKFIKRRFAQDFDRIKFYLREKTYTNKIKQTNYSKVIFGIPIIGLILLTFIANIFFSNKMIVLIFLILNIFYILLHIGFLRFVSNTKGIKNVAGILMMFYLDTFLMLMAVTFGSLNFFLSKEKY